MRQPAVIALLTIVAALSAIGDAQAQGLPPYGPPPPVFVAPGPPPPPGYVATETMPYDGALLPQEVVGILRSTGYSPLSAPARRGRYYVVAVLNPGGLDGRVTMDAMTGRFLGFAPAGRGGRPSGRSMAAYPTPGRGLRPPVDVPNAVAHAPLAAPLPSPRPEPDVATTGALKRDSSRTAENRPARTKPADPVELKSTFGAPDGPKLQPTEAIPPVQTFE